jgi:hypothetical protein
LTSCSPALLCAADSTAGKAKQEIRRSGGLFHKRILLIS